MPVAASSSVAPQVSPEGNLENVAREKLRFEENNMLDNAEANVDALDEGDGDVDADVSQWEWKYNEEIDAKLLDFDYDQGIPNANFIYHNKLPKSGSTTMHDILR